MLIIVCIKQVPETQEVRLDPETHTLKREGVKSIINPLTSMPWKRASGSRRPKGAR